MSEDRKYVAPSRQGKVNIGIWTTPERRNALKVKAAQTGKTVQELVEQAIDKVVSGRVEIG